MFNKKTDRWERCDRTINDIDHIGIVVRDLEKAIKLLENLDLRVSRREDIEHLKVRVAFFEVSGNRIELISPSSEDHELTHHIENHGEGLHHIAFQVEDINQTIKKLENMGIGLAQGKPRGEGHEGKEIAFLNPEDTCGILIEVCQGKK